MRLSHEIRTMLRKIGEIYRSDPRTNKQQQRIPRSQSQAVFPKSSRDLSKLIVTGDNTRPENRFLKRLRALENSSPYLPSWFKKRSEIIDILVPMDCIEKATPLYVRKESGVSFPAVT